MPVITDSKVSRSRGSTSAPLGCDLVILNPEQDNYVGLDEIGRRVWELLATPVVVKDLCLQMSSEYQGNSQEITGDIVALLNELLADGLIDATNPAAA